MSLMKQQSVINHWYTIIWETENTKSILNRTTL